MHDSERDGLPNSDGDIDDHATVVSIKSQRTRARTTKASSTSIRPGRLHGTGSGASVSSLPSAGTPLTAMRRADLVADVLLGDEVTRARGFSLTIGLLSAGVLCVLPLLGGHAAAKLACAVALALISAGSAVMYRVSRPGTGYRRSLHRAYGVLIVTGVVAVEYYIGLFSPVTLVVTLGVYYLGQSSDRFQALGLSLYACGSYVVLALLVAFGVVPDVGLFAATLATHESRLFAIVAVASVLLLTVRMARVSRESMTAAIERSNDALLAVQQREALLAEAQQHLERALHVAVGKPGIHTGQLAGEYRLGVVIGVGAMGEIYEAVRESDGMPAAVKLMHAGMQSRDDLVRRFLREAEICQRLSSPHIVQVFEAAAMDDGTPYMAMELLQGSDLAAHLRKQGPMSLGDVVALAQDLAAGLSHAHEEGIVHRDLKPVNVFLARDEETQAQRWKILDFGISKLNESTGTLTNVGIVGTPGYMSPEQAQGHAVDARSDVFSMCAVMYRALTGRPAFTGSDTPQIMFEVVYKSPMCPSLAVDLVPPEVDAVLAIGLAKKPEHRWATAMELAEALSAASQGNLRAEWKTRARRIVRDQPWGQPVKLA